MTQKEIINALIPMYEEAIEKGKSCDTYSVFCDYLYETGLGQGICAAIELNFDDDADNHGDWIYPLCKPYYWCHCPATADSVEKAIEYLAFRLNKLKEILSSLDENTLKEVL